MRIRSATLNVFAFAASVACSAAIAQDAKAPLTRSEAKAETRAAEKAGKLTPAGESPIPMDRSAKLKATKTRAERKAETREARKAGDLRPAGEGIDTKADRAADSAKSIKTRADRKAETLDAARKGQLTPAGENAGGPPK